MKLCKDTTASAWPVVIAIIVLALAAFLVLIFGHVLEPFFNVGGGTDDTVDSEIHKPRKLGWQFLQIIWPNGLLLVILIGTLAGMIMYYQKRYYKEAP